MIDKESAIAELNKELNAIGFGTELAGHFPNAQPAVICRTLAAHLSEAGGSDALWIGREDSVLAACARELQRRGEVTRFDSLSDTSDLIAAEKTDFDSLGDLGSNWFSIYIQPYSIWCFSILTDDETIRRLRAYCVEEFEEGKDKTKVEISRPVA